jgi:hypothetical protein
MARVLLLATIVELAVNWGISTPEAWAQEVFDVQVSVTVTQDSKTGIFSPRQQNLWMNSGSGRSPSV